MDGSKRRVVVVGATGEIGRALSKRIPGEGSYELVVFSRDLEKAHKVVPGAAEYVAWQPEEDGAWATALDGAYGVINMAGAPIFGVRWTPEYRKEMQKNRMTIARGLVKGMTNARVRPQVFIQGSSVGSYGFTTMSNNVFDEDTPADDDLFSQESLEIEREAQKAEAVGVRTVLVRTGFVLDRNGGGLPAMAQSARRFTGGILLPGKQWLPWIHIEDEIGIILQALEDTRIRGAINAIAPEVLTNRDFMRTMGRILHRPILMRVPGFILQTFMGDSAAILTRGKRIRPKRIIDWGYQFHYATLEAALRDLLS